MDLKLIVNEPWKVLPPPQISQAGPIASSSTAVGRSNTDLRDIDFRKPVLVPVKKLYLNSEQEGAIRSLYSDNREFRMRFNTKAPSQASADVVLYTNGLSLDGKPQSGVENCWLTAWSSSWGSKKGLKKRSLLQCSSGYNTAARQARDKRGSLNPIEWSRQADYEFSGCLAHADVTWNRESGQIERIIGYFEHSKNCQAAATIRSVLSETRLLRDQGDNNVERP